MADLAGWQTWIDGSELLRHREHVLGVPEIRDRDEDLAGVYGQVETEFVQEQHERLVLQDGGLFGGPGNHRDGEVQHWKKVTL